MKSASTGLDRGLLLGDALFETVLLRRGRPFRLDRHLRRLRGAASRVGIPVPADLESTIEGEIERWGATLGRGAGAPDYPRHGALRLTLTRGPGDGLAPPETPEPALYLTVRAIERGAPETRGGISARCFGRVEERALSAGIKTTGYLERILALRAAREVGADEAVLVNSADRLVEGSASNLFRVSGGVLWTPSVAEGALPGITREAVLELAAVLGIPTATGDDGPGAPTLAEALLADELFLTSSLRGPIPLVRLDETPIGHGERRGRPGPIFQRLARSLEALIDDETSAS